VARLLKTFRLHKMLELCAAEQLFAPEEGEEEEGVSLVDRAVAQAVRHRLPTEATRFQSKSRSITERGSAHVGFMVDKSGIGAGFLRVLRFPLSIIIPSTAPY
jgi:hypothetical protein